MSFIGAINQFQLGDCWDQYEEQVEQFIKANKVEKEREVAVFISIIGNDTYSLLRDLCFPDKPSSKTLEELCKILKTHLQPPTSFIAERYNFRQRKQREGESLQDFVASLKKLAKTCNFESKLEDELRDQFVCGVRDVCIKKRLLRESKLTYQSAVEIAMSIEMVNKNSADLFPTGYVNKVKFSRRTSPQFKDKKALDSKKNVNACMRCNGSHHESKCYAKNWKCFSCGKTGHVAKCCRSKQRRRSNSNQVHQVEPNVPEVQLQHKVSVPDRNTDSEEEEVILQSVHLLGSSKESYQISVNIEGVDLKMEVDTGAAISVIPEPLYNEHLRQIPLTKSRLTLKTYSGEALQVKGSAQVQVTYGNQRAILPLTVVGISGPKVPALFGRNWLEHIKLNWNEITNRQPAINLVSEGNTTLKEKDELLRKFPNVFKEGDGHIKHYKAHISLKEDAIPVFAKARPVPFNLRDKVAQELQRLESEGIIEKVTKSDWATPLVVVPKAQSDKIRLCGDYSVTVNPVSRTDHYPLPNTEDLFASLAGGKVFTKLDLTNAYQQLELTKQSAALLTVNTHLGLYRYKRLPFGISSAPAIFQCVMDQILRGISNVCCYLDDVLIIGSDLKSCKNTVVEVLTRLQEHNVRVNLHKCLFFQNSVEYLGHKIDPTGIHPTEAKLRAIKDAPEPKNVSQLRSFLGLINYYRRFLPNVATLLHPLYELLQVDKDWKWSKKCQEAFLKAKEDLCSDRVLVHYDSSKPLILTCDASTVGLGAVLSHTEEDKTEKPIAFASRTLTAAESNYAQIEKEAAAIIFGVKKFHRFLYGRKFKLVTDHKPLTAIFSPKSGVPTIAAARIQRWAMILNAYSYDIEYRDGQSISHADALSRLPVEEHDAPKQRIETVNYFAPLRETPLRVMDIARHTRQDRVLSRVLDWTRYGWPTDDVGPEFTPFARRKDELSVEQDCLTWGSRVIVPTSLRSQALELLHEEHPGVVRMKMLARSYLWWPNLDQEIESCVSSCPVCQALLSSTQPAPLQPWNWATSPWERVHIDIAFVGKFKFLILFDSFSKWIEVQEIKLLSTESIIEVLRKTCASYGLPKMVVHDNGRQFTSAEFQQFLRENGIKDACTPIYHPASNGAAERGIQTVKRALKKLAYHDRHFNRRPRSVREKIDSYLLSYRSTPQTITGQTPAELFLKRQLRTRLTLLKPNLNEAMQTKTAKLKQKRDERRGPPKTFAPGDKVYVRSFNRKYVNWVPGQVSRRIGGVMYAVELTAGGEKVVHVDHMRRRDSDNLG